MAAHVAHPQAIRRLLHACPISQHNRPELVFPDAEMLFAWCPDVHPRLFTLLAYHKRPLTLIVPAGPLVPLALIDGRGEVAVRLAMDSFCYRVCEDLEDPLVCAHAIGFGETEAPTCFGKIRSDVLRAADLTVKRRQREEIGRFRAVSARYGKEGEIDFKS